MTSTADTCSLAGGATREQSLGAMLRRTVARFPEKIALRCGGGDWTYAELDRLSDRIALSLIAVGIARGDRVAVMARNSRWFVALRFAVARTGAILVPINFMLTAKDTAFILNNSDVSLLFCDTACSDVATAAAALAGIRSVRGLPDAQDEEPDLPPLSELTAQEHDHAIVLPIVDGRTPLQILYTSGTEANPKVRTAVQN